MIPAEFSRTERALLIAALVFVIIIAIKMSMSMVSIFITSIFLTLLCLPLRNWLTKKGLSDIIAVTVITVIACLVVIAFAMITVLSVNMLIADIPQFQQDLNVRLANINDLLHSAGISSAAFTMPSLDLASMASLVASSVMTLSEAGMSLFFIAITTFFMLLEAPKISDRFRRLGGRNPEMASQVSRMAGYIMDFIVVRTETNAIHGILFGGFLSIMGVHAAVLWGILTFVLGYIPFIGLIIAAIPAIFFAWLQFGVWGAVAVIAVVCILNLVVENPVYSFLAAKKFDMPALVVIISVVFWGWLLGLIGMFFAIPLTLLVILVFQLSDECRWINRVLGVSHLFDDLPAEPPPPDS